MPTASDDFAEDAEVALAEALESLGVRLTAATEGADLAIDLDGGRKVQLEVEALANASPGRVRAKLEAVEGADESLPILVADAIPRASRELLDAAGWAWYDRRGHVRLRAPGLYVDTTSMSAGRDTAPPGSAITANAGVVVAYELLRRPDHPLAVRRTAAAAGINPSSVSRALTRLKEAALVRPDGRPLVPELFWALADVWPRDATPLKRSPEPDDQLADGWVMGGTPAALAWGVPVVASEAMPPELLVPSAAAVRRAQQRYGRAASPVTAAALIRAAAVPGVLDEAVTRPGAPWPIAHPLAVALDLATDQTRGAEIVDSWSPPPPYARVW